MAEPPLLAGAVHGTVGGALPGGVGPTGGAPRAPAHEGRALVDVTASPRPEPTEPTPNAPTGRPDAASAAFSSATVRHGCFWRISAFTAAAWGAAADVPKNGLRPEVGLSVVVTPSVAAKSSCFVAHGLAAAGVVP